MGPSPRRSAASALTQEEWAAMRRPPQQATRKHSGPKEQWVIKTSIPDEYRSNWPSDSAYWGTKRDRYPGITPYISNARKYESEDDAR
jgi:hypothetical protein